MKDAHCVMNIYCRLGQAFCMVHILLIIWMCVHVVMHPVLKVAKTHFAVCIPVCDTLYLHYLHGDNEGLSLAV